MNFKMRTFSMIRPPRFKSFAEAVDKLPNGQDYQEKELVDVVVRKTEIFVAAQGPKTPLDLISARLLMALGPLFAQKEIDVLDFGGAAGFHFFVARQALTHGPNLNWHVLETEQMTSAAKRLEECGIRFFNNLGDATKNMQKIDLVIASSVLQYCENPLDVLSELLDLSPRFLLITRTPLIEDGESWFSIQSSRMRDNGPGPLPAEFKDRKVYYPTSFVPLARVERILQEKYLIRFSLDEGPWVEEFKRLRSWGFFCELKPGS